MPYVDGWKDTIGWGGWMVIIGRRYSNFEEHLWR